MFKAHFTLEHIEEQQSKGLARVHAEVTLPSAAIMKGHKSGGTKQQKCILSQFWKPEL